MKIKKDIFGCRREKSRTKRNNIFKGRGLRIFFGGKIQKLETLKLYIASLEFSDTTSFH